MWAHGPDGEWSIESAALICVNSFRPAHQPVERHFQVVGESARLGRELLGSERCPNQPRQTAAEANQCSATVVSPR
jgi:hypothetical protein